MMGGCGCGLGVAAGYELIDPRTGEPFVEEDTLQYPTTGGVSVSDYLAAWEGQRGVTTHGVERTPKQCYEECKAMEAQGTRFIVSCADGCGYHPSLVLGISDTTLLIGGAAAILLLIMVTR